MYMAMINWHINEKFIFKNIFNLISLMFNLSYLNFYAYQHYESLCATNYNIKFISIYRKSLHLLM